MDFAQGFEIWRELGETAAASTIDFAALTAIHYVHRLVAYVVFVALGVLAWRLRARRRCARRRAGWPAWRCCSSPPAWATCCSAGRWSRRVLHTGGAAALVVVLTWALCESRARARPRAAPRAARCRRAGWRSA